MHKVATGKEQSTSDKSKRSSSDPSAYDAFSFDLKWQPNVARQGCAQKVDCCIEAFGRLANSSYGPEGSQNKFMALDGMHGIPNCRNFSYSISKANDKSKASSLDLQKCNRAIGINSIKSKLLNAPRCQATCENADRHNIKKATPRPTFIM